MAKVLRAALTEPSAAVLVFSVAVAVTLAALKKAQTWTIEVEKYNRLPIYVSYLAGVTTEEVDTSC